MTRNHIILLIAACILASCIGASIAALLSR